LNNHSHNEPDGSYHIPVLVDEVVAALRLETASLVADVTLGDGGYSLAILENMQPGGRVVGLDLDREAVERAQRRLAFFGDRFLPLQGNFREIKQILESKGLERLDGLVADLGVSRRQISDPAKGFMFSSNGPLLMKMDMDQSLSAEQVINEYDETTLADILWKYGEERHSRRIAAALVRQREKGRIQDTETVAQVVRQTVHGPHVVKSLARVFQAFRIMTNSEIDNLRALLPQTLDLLAPGGRAVFVSYHSLEDREIKLFMSAHSRPCICPPDLPVCVCHRRADIRIIGRSVAASAEEQALNKSSRSARMRVMEKV